MICGGLKLFILGVEFDCDSFVLGFSVFGLNLDMD